MSLAWILFIAYMLATAWLSWLGFRRTRDFGSFALGSGHMSPVTVGITLAASTASAATFIITPGFIYVDGLAAWIHMVPALFIGFMLGISMLSFRFRRIGSSQGALTIPDWIGHRYGSRNYALFFALTNLLGFAFVVLLVGGISIVMQNLLGIGNTSALVLTLVFVTGYVFIGGTYAHVFTNLLQGSLMILVAVVILGSGIVQLLQDGPGFIDTMNSINPHLLQPVNPEGQLFNEPYSVFIAGLLVGFAVVCQPHILTKALYVDSDRDVRRYLIVLGVVLAIFFLLGSVGFFAHLAVPAEALNDPLTGQFRQDLVMTMYLKTVFPDWLFTVVSVVLLAAAMSTLDGLLVGMSTITANDLLLNLRRRHDQSGDEKAQLAWAYKASHVVLVIIAAGAFVVLQNPPKLLGIFGQVGVYGLTIAALPPLLAGVLFRKVPIALMWAASMAGMAVHFGLYVYGAQLFPGSSLTFANPGVTVSLAVLIVVFPCLMICWWLSNANERSA